MSPAPAIAPRAARTPRTVLTVSSGLGPIEARRFVAALAHELERALVRSGARVVERRVTGVRGFGGVGGVPSEASVTSPPRSVDLVFEGGDASPWIGTHALLEPSEGRARRGRRARKRWFVGVTLREEQAGDPGRVTSGISPVSPGDLEIRYCRARGPGGQHVNRTESAVRVRHRPTGLVVRVEDERARARNLAVAIRRIDALLEAQAASRVAEAREARRTACLAVERGRPVATWRLAEGRLVEVTDA